MKRSLTLLTILAGLSFWLTALSARAADDVTNQDSTVIATNVDQTATVTATNIDQTALGPKKRAHWQQHLTLGPGDVLNISLLDQLDSQRNNIVIGPDGRINYMEVQNFMAAGQTVDEMRTNLDTALSSFYRGARSIVIPTLFRSKKYFMLGAVQEKGVYLLDRPTSIVEAVARAGGLESGVLDRSPMELADLTHSFLVRDGKRLPVDFENLFLHGDLTQNIPLEPNDYLFFAPASLNEVYVLGEVTSPGPIPWDRSTTIISALTRRGSFTPDSFRQRVLVIRGSLNHPETFVVNTADILSAKAPDFKLEPKDIVYVHYKPWVFAQQLLEGASATFVQAALVAYTGQYIGPFIASPIIKP